MKTESPGMSLLRKIGFESAAWSLRRLYCPVDKSALVLEVGSGGNPYPRSNVLLDAYEETRERHWAPLVSDRPTVLGFVERLPFRDKVFDFVIASHVLEHSPYPEKFLSELQRVAKAGYIETPDAFMERVNPYRDHRLEVTERNGELLISKKPGWVVEPDTVELYEERVKRLLTRAVIPKHPFLFHLRFYWKGKIPFTIVNPGTDAAWPAPVSDSGNNFPANPGLRTLLLSALTRDYSQKARNRSINIAELLQCPHCGEKITASGDQFACQACSALFPVRKGVPVMLP